MLCLLTAPLSAQQQARIRQETSYHADPDGTRLGILDPGRSLRLMGSRGEWREVMLDGWIWTASLGPTTRDGFNQVVNLNGGENLRLEANGERLGRALEGVLLNRVTRRGGWTRVQRRVWVQASAVAGSAPAGAAAGAGGQAAPAPPPPPPPPAPPPVPAHEPVTINPNAELRTGPGSELIGKAPLELRAEVLERSAGWVRVRTEAWVREQDVAAAPMPGEGKVSLQDLQEAPERFVGREVLWRLQFLALQVADELRPEIPKGQSYLLTRGPLPEAGFVYVVVTREQADRFRGMQPLDDFVAQATILAPRTRYLPIPVLQLQRVP